MKREKKIIISHNINNKNATKNEKTIKTKDFNLKK